MKYYQYAPGKKEMEEAYNEYKGIDIAENENKYTSYSEEDEKNK